MIQSRLMKQLEDALSGEDLSHATVSRTTIDVRQFQAWHEETTGEDLQVEILLPGQSPSLHTRHDKVGG